ncbi:MAG: hypothetical protein ACD_11C00103G0013 [uncultured bacterium]|nr:MAG: hypothetical protein ACD_11C00103G0013 [uncultured bacterium]HBR71918.1 preprotein translocase subunit SecE [Candidatus Moranbacteria bacterium]
MLNQIIAFIREAKIELSKVNWPTKKQTKNYTILVVVISLIVAAFLGGLDYFFSYLLKQFLLK